MRLKTFSAPSMTEALKIVKEHFGEEAIIVSSKKADNGSGVCVTAAIDKDELSINSNDLHAVSEANDFDIITDNKLQKIPTDKRLNAIKKGAIDLELQETLFHFGHY